MQRQVHQVDIDGEARQIALEQVDGRAALKRKTVFLRDDRQETQEQADLCDVGFTQCHRIPPAR